MNLRTILIILTIIIILVVLGFTFQKFANDSGPKTLSDDPNYQFVKEKYNLSEDQLQILSTVNQEDHQ